MNFSSFFRVFEQKKLPVAPFSVNFFAIMYKTFKFSQAAQVSKNKIIVLAGPAQNEFLGSVLGQCFLT